MIELILNNQLSLAKQLLGEEYNRFIEKNLAEIALKRFKSTRTSGENCEFEHFHFEIYKTSLYFEVSYLKSKVALYTHNPLNFIEVFDVPQETEEFKIKLCQTLYQLLTRND